MLTCPHPYEVYNPLQYYTNNCEKAERDRPFRIFYLSGDLLNFSSHHKVWAGLEITICLSNPKRSVILGHREDALFSVTFRKRICLFCPLGFPVLYKEFKEVYNCLFPASTVFLFCYLLKLHEPHCSYSEHEFH